MFANATIQTTRLRFSPLRNVATVSARIAFMKSSILDSGIAASSLVVLGMAALLTPGAATRADILYLVSGGQIEGRILKRTDESVEIEIGAGTMAFPMSSIERIEEARSVLDDYDERKSKIDASNTAGLLALADWASSQGLDNQARLAYRQVLNVEPDNVSANEALGRVNVDGRWLAEADAWLARGYVLFEGKWMLPEQQVAIEQQRGQEAAVEQARADARAAQARADEAEARARAAEADARAAEDADYHDDDWYYPGYGPRWPLRPVHPIPPVPEPEPEPVRPINRPLNR
jgi:hypothetical protein